MKVLVTGGAGFIGSHVSARLLQRGDEVICVDDFCDYYDPAIKERNVAQFEKNPRHSVFRYDISDKEKMTELFEQKKPDKVIHLAARAGVRYSLENPVLYSEVNNVGTAVLLELSRVHNVENFVFASSSSVYGENKKVPFAEDDNVDFPISPYAATKKAGELQCYTYSHLYGLNCSCLRFFTVYGPSGRPDMAPFKFIDWINRGVELTKFGDGTTRRDYTYIDDIVTGVVAALDENYKYEVFNLGNSRTVELNEFISIVEGLVDKKANIKQMPMQPGDVPLTNADISKSKEMLGYNPQTPFEDGMEKMVNWYNEIYG